MGLVPSGLQATADRYSYLPGVPLSVAIALLLERRGRHAPFRKRRLDREKVDLALFLGLAVAAVVTLAALTWRQTQYWRDSVTLWTHAVEVDSRNDVALYNLGAALSDAGRRDQAIARYEQVLAIVPNIPPRAATAISSRRHGWKRKETDLPEVETSTAPSHATPKR